MRLAVSFLVLFASAAFAGDWTSYSNARFGVGIDVPPGFVNDMPAPANGDGLTFHSADGKAELLVWGNNLADEDFNQHVAARLKSDTEDGWNISYVAGVDGTGWQVYSGTRKGRLLYAKSISSCKNTQAVHFRIEYPQAQKNDYDPVVERLSKSLTAGPASDCP
ncbi:MAG: hypothetical protein WCE69_03175 [Aestuariivirga sp.]